MDTLGGAEFVPETTYLNTSTCGLLPRRAVEAVRALALSSATGQPDGAGDFAVVEAARASFARLVQVPADRVSVGTAVAVHVGLIAASLPPGSEVLLPEGEFSSVVTPFTVRGDLKPRYVPLESLAAEVRPGTALVAFSAVQSSDGRTADLAGVRAAAAAHGARTLLDATQAAGWLPVDAREYDYTVTGGYKFLVSPRGTSFLTVGEEAQESLVPILAGWVAGEDMWASTYGPVGELAVSARRFDQPVPFLAYHGAERSLSLLSEIGVGTIHAHSTALAARFRAGLREIGHEPAGTGHADGSAIVAVAGLGDRQEALARAGVSVAVRAGNLRAAFHLYNSTADVDRALEVLAG
ncbi:aminotransferase class V-fold PLP-dependent enzyme [Streptomyces sp. NPDC059209]|uniref:aminotransferase class V-fold PLP-dependent enzyme n=1 Tax=Streptomyces sp. NPDC059209 TaxID=3346769 RepID=UPI00368492D4